MAEESGDPSAAARSPVRHVVFIIHGIGRQKDKVGPSLLENVEVFKKNQKELIKMHFPHMDEDCIRYLVIEWHSVLHKMDTVDRQIKHITLPTVPIMRHFCNDYLADVPLYFQEPHQSIVRNIVIGQLNDLYTVFMENNPDFKGTFSILAHSLGSVISWDLMKMKPYPLRFKLSHIMMYGSPLAAVLTMRGLKCRCDNRDAPDVPALPEALPPPDVLLHNIFSLYDPLAYRLEPFFDTHPPPTPYQTPSTRRKMDLKMSLPSLNIGLPTLPNLPNLPNLPHLPNLPNLPNFTFLSSISFPSLASFQRSSSTGHGLNNNGSDNANGSSNGTANGKEAHRSLADLSFPDLSSYTGSLPGWSHLFTFPAGDDSKKSPNVSPPQSPIPTSPPTPTGKQRRRQGMEQGSEMHVDAGGPSFQDDGLRSLSRSPPHYEGFARKRFRNLFDLGGGTAKTTTGTEGEMAPQSAAESSSSSSSSSVASSIPSTSGTFFAGTSAVAAGPRLVGGTTRAALSARIVQSKRMLRSFITTGKAAGTENSTELQDFATKLPSTSSLSTGNSFIVGIGTESDQMEEDENGLQLAKEETEHKMIPAEAFPSVVIRVNSGSNAVGDGTGSGLGIIEREGSVYEDALATTTETMSTIDADTAAAMDISRSPLLGRISGLASQFRERVLSNVFGGGISAAPGLVMAGGEDGDNSAGAAAAEEEEEEQEEDKAAAGMVDGAEEIEKEGSLLFSKGNKHGIGADEAEERMQEVEEEIEEELDDIRGVHDHDHRQPHLHHRHHHHQPAPDSVSMVQRPPHGPSQPRSAVHDQRKTAPTESSGVHLARNSSFLGTVAAEVPLSEKELVVGDPAEFAGNPQHRPLPVNFGSSSESKEGSPLMDVVPGGGGAGLAGSGARTFSSLGLQNASSSALVSNAPLMDGSSSESSQSSQSNQGQSQTTAAEIFTDAQGEHQPSSDDGNRQTVRSEKDEELWALVNRVDFSLPEEFYFRVPEYLNGLRGHISYWPNKDFAFHILRVLFLTDEARRIYGSHLIPSSSSLTAAVGVMAT